MEFKSIGVVGAGLMGAEIALVFALAGHDVVLADQSEGSLDRARTRMAETLAKGAARGFYSQDVADRASESVRAVVGLSTFTRCDFVVEAVFEDLAVKTSVIQELDRLCPETTLIATNTSTIPISTLAATVSSARAPSFVGAHFFSPASRMRLVEVIPAFQTAPETVAAVIDLLTAAGKQPIRVKDVAGFAVNRVLHMFLIEAVRLVEEGVATPEDIDTACRLGLGHPMGPFELMDATTSSLCLQAQEIMQEAYGERFRPRPLLKQRVRAGLVGGRGRPGWRNA
ncbi:MAG: 3-hydroxyacyl-CoA dehydrogenase family protein [Phenylobacterium sp.]